MITSSVKQLTLEEKILLAQEGNDEIQNELIKKYQPFIARCVSDVCKRYIDPKHDDEFSIGLSGFNEAILHYSSDRGSSFFAFAKVVVSRKVIDYIRSVQRVPITDSLDANFDEDTMENPKEIIIAKKMYEEKEDAWHRREEIKDFIQKLATYKLTLEELTKVAPKHKDARSSAVSVARILCNNEKMKEYVQTRKKLPIKQLLDHVDVSKKTLERNRKFIIAMFIVLTEDYVFLQDYLKGVGQ